MASRFRVGDTLDSPGDGLCRIITRVWRENQQDMVEYKDAHESHFTVDTSAIVGAIVTKYVKHVYGPLVLPSGI